jgi:hypothetical protein
MFPNQHVVLSTVDFDTFQRRRPTEAALFSGCQQLPAAPSAFAAVKQPSKPPVACASQPDQRREPWARWRKLEAKIDELVTFKVPQSPLPAMNNLVGTGAARKLNSASNSAPPITAQSSWPGAVSPRFATPSEVL